ncbi:hypothetical protein BT69DRAFT_1322247 [Atractiella rhizophila]|nr:hypothetical protein BT69DRAFT_1322247 [Atractiella rhizophila]
MGLPCPTCQRPNLSKFYCSSCLTDRRSGHHATLSKVESLREEVRKRAKELLVEGGVEAERKGKAEKWEVEWTLAKALQEQARLREECKDYSTRLSSLRTSLDRRRQNLSRARQQLTYLSYPPSAPSTSSSATNSTNPFLSQPVTPLLSPDASALESVPGGLRQADKEVKVSKRRWEELSEEIAKTRRVLVSELIEVFEVGEVEGTAGREWTIAGCRLGLIGDLRRMKDSQSIIRVNTALWHLAHLTRLLAMYLAVKLPFNPDLAAFGPGKPGMTTSSLEGGWSTKYASRYPLYISTSSIDPSSSSPSATSSLSVRPSPQSTEALLTALSMLSYSISYLAHTQGARVSQLSASGGENMLSILYHALRLEVEDAERLGTRSHVTGKRKLSLPNLQRDPSANGLGLVGVEEGESWDVDFERVLQIVCAKDGSGGASGSGSTEHRRSRSESSSGTGGGYGFIKRRDGREKERSRAERATVKEEVEEEGGWSLV